MLKNKAIAWQKVVEKYLLHPTSVVEWGNKYKLCFSTLHNLWLEINDERDKKCWQYFIWFAFIVIYFLWDPGIRYETESRKIGFLNGQTCTWRFMRCECSIYGSRYSECEREEEILTYWSLTTPGWMKLIYTYTQAATALWIKSINLEKMFLIKLEDLNLNFTIGVKFPVQMSHKAT